MLLIARPYSNLLVFSCTWASSASEKNHIWSRANWNHVFITTANRDSWNCLLVFNEMKRSSCSVFDNDEGANNRLDVDGEERPSRLLIPAIAAAESVGSDTDDDDDDDEVATDIILGTRTQSRMVVAAMHSADTCSANWCRDALTNLVRCQCGGAFADIFNFHPSPSNHPNNLFRFFVVHMFREGMLITLTMLAPHFSLLTRLLPLRDQLVSNCDLLEKRARAHAARRQRRADSACSCARSNPASGLWRALARGCGRRAAATAGGGVGVLPPAPRRAESRVDSGAGRTVRRCVLAAEHGPAISTPILSSPLLLVLHRRYK